MNIEFLLLKNKKKHAIASPTSATEILGKTKKLKKGKNKIIIQIILFMITV